MRNMRVCMLTTSFPRNRDDFAGAFVCDLARGLTRRGVEVRIVAPHDSHIPRYEVYDRLHVHRFVYAWPWGWQRLAYGDGIPNNLRRYPWMALQIPSFLVTFFLTAWRVCANCDIIHVHWAPLAWLGLVLRLRYRVPIVLTVHGTDVRSIPPFLVRPVLKRVDAVVAAAAETELLLQKLGVTHHYFISLPIDEEAFQPGMDDSAVAEEIGVQSGEDVVTFVGRLDDFKDPLTLVRAAPLVLAQHPQAHFVIVGDGPLAPDLRTAIADLGLQRAVHLVGSRRDVGSFLALSKLFVALSPVENAWSMTIAEAMHMRVPCIITRAGQTERLFTHQEDSYLIAPRDEVALAEAILRLLSSAGERTRLAQGALALLQKHGKDTESIMQRMLGVYRSVLEESVAA